MFGDVLRLPVNKIFTLLIFFDEKMIKRMILTYYYVWLQGHTRSKYAKDFSNYWFRAFLQLVMTQFFMLFYLLIVINLLFDVKITRFFGKVSFLFLFVILPSLALYHLLFSVYKADKENDDPTKFGINITKRSKVICWLVYAFVPLSVCILIYLGF